MRTETKRLLIRSFSLADIPAYAAIVADPRVTIYLGDGSPHNYAEAQAYILDCIARDQRTGISRYAVIRKSEKDLIGFCGFKELADYVDFGWRYAYGARGQGYATEAAFKVLDYGHSELRLTNMAAGSYIENVASVRIIQQLGFKYVAHDEFYGQATVRYHQAPVV